MNPKPLALTVLAAIMAMPTPAQEAADSTARQLQEIVVTERPVARRLQTAVLGAETLELGLLGNTPAFMSERDIIKSIALLPGVHGEGEGAGGFEVRGGTAAQNLVLLDGITLYNPSHVMGVFSTFNDHAVGRATLYKGPIPAAYGSATASVLETSLAPGSMERWHGKGTIGLLAAKLSAGGPLVKDHLSLAVAARRSYVDMFLKMIPQYKSTTMNFYDVTAKLRLETRRGDIVDASVITARDNMGISDLMTMRWGNTGGSVNWSAPAGEKWHFRTSAAATSYTARMGMDIMGTDQVLNEYIRDIAADFRATFTPTDNHRFSAGVRSQWLRVNSGEFLLNASREKDLRSGWLGAGWVDYDGTVADRLGIAAGMRFSYFSAGHHFNPEPRASLKYSINNLHNIKAGAGMNSQVIHSVKSSSTSFPFDRPALSGAGISPETAVQYSIGYAGMTRRGDYDWSAEAYWKNLEHVYDYRDGMTMFSQTDIESIILGGKGRSYGLELMFRKNTGRLSGWLSYTLSKTQTRIDGINGGRWYDATNDRRHDFSAVAMFKLTDRWTLSGSWVYSSGQPLTAPDVKYRLDGQTVYYYSQRNGYHTPATHRLDLSANYIHEGKRVTYEWSIGIYNAYCRYNPYIVYFEDDDTKPSGTRAVQRSLYGLLPSVSYTLKF